MKKPPPARPTPTPSAPNKPLGAFCSDIKNSTQRIEKLQQAALKHHKTYLEALRKKFIKLSGHRADDMWIPGDALWGVFRGSAEEGIAESITQSLWAMVASCAYGLAIANSEAKRTVEPLKMRGAFLVGPVMRETVFDTKTPLYNGSALNACGRLQALVGDNTIVAGFVLPYRRFDDFPAVEVQAGSPVIYASGRDGLESYLHQVRDLHDLGCRVEVDVVPKDDRNVLRFQGWRKRTKLRGLEQCTILTTIFKVKLKNEADLQMIYNPHGSWDRHESVISVPSAGVLKIDLHDLIGANNHSFGFLKEVYKRGDLLFTIPADVEKGIGLNWSGRGDRPRVNDHKVDNVDFGRQKSCILPTDRLHRFRVLVQGGKKINERVLYLSLVEDGVLRSYDNHSDFLDTASPTLEISFTQQP